MAVRDLIPLTLVPREANRLTGTAAVGYRALYSRVVDGRIPAEQINGRWFVRRADIPAVAESFGLTVPADRAAA